MHSTTHAATEEVHGILAAARQRARARTAGTSPPDYTALNTMVRRQRAALTHAVNSRDPNAVVLTVGDTVRERGAPGAMWPDDWSRWHRALDDVLPCADADIRDLV